MTDDENKPEAARNNGGATRAKPRGKPFQPGNPGRFQHGNPGRPKGAKHKTTLAIEKLLQGEAKAITRKVVELAKGGDSTAIRLVMERVAPVRKGRPVDLTLPEISTAADVVKALGIVAQAVGDGELTPDEGATVAGILEVKRRALETEDLEKRLSALEARGKVA